jgi:hypothetical protein
MYGTVTVLMQNQLKRGLTLMYGTGTLLMQNAPGASLMASIDAVANGPASTNVLLQ